MERLRIATVWFGGCAGCHMSFLDLDEALIEMTSKVEVVYSPIIDVKEYPMNVDVALIEGAVCNEEHLRLAAIIRAQTKLVVAFGDCAVTGNVTAIRNQLGLNNAEYVLQRAYVEAAQLNPVAPQCPGIVPTLLEQVTPLQDAMAVDYYLPGCPPSASRIKRFLEQVLAGREPVLTGDDLRFG